jgi:hypothetical protein
VKVVQQVLGYKSATMTLDRYGHLFGDRLDVVADGIDAPRVGPYCPSVADTVVDLAAERQMATAQIVPGYVVGGDEGTRTPNPRLAKAVLYHLSYVPATSQRCGEASTQRVEVASRQRAASACAFLRLRTTTNAPAANATSTTDLSTGHLRST